MGLIPGIDNLDIMSIDKKIKLLKYYSLNEEERNKISYNELYVNEETLKVMEETANGVNVSKPFDNVEDSNTIILSENIISLIYSLIVFFEFFYNIVYL